MTEIKNRHGDTVTPITDREHDLIKGFFAAAGCEMSAAKAEDAYWRLCAMLNEAFGRSMKCDYPGEVLGNKGLKL
jgi:hypothetical protein